MAKRRQGDHEPFDVYKVSLKSLVGRLIKTISEQKLVKLLVENTKPTLRHELMHADSATRGLSQSEMVEATLQ